MYDKGGRGVNAGEEEGGCQGAEEEAELIPHDTRSWGLGEGGGGEIVRRVRR